MTNYSSRQSLHRIACFLPVKRIMELAVKRRVMGVFKEIRQNVPLSMSLLEESF